MIPNVDSYLPETNIQQRIAELGKKITEDYRDQDLLVVGILNGSFMFTADLVRKIKTPHEIDFISVSSYGADTVSSGKVTMELDFRKEIKGRHVLLVEDIVDTGTTLSSLRPFLEERGPASLKLASLLHKPSRTKYPTTIDYLGFEIDDLFVVGYGLDLDGKYRELPYIGTYHGD
jgi:hypoxanthine phosphoribosyltransferase